MDITQIPNELARTVYQRLCNDGRFDGFVIDRLWVCLPMQVKLLLEPCEGMQFIKAAVMPQWIVPVLFIRYAGPALLADSAQWENLKLLANTLKTMTLVDVLQVAGNNICLRVWYDYAANDWQKRSFPLPGDMGGGNADR